MNECKISIQNAQGETRAERGGHLVFAESYTPGDRIVLLGCPMLFHEGPDEDASITGILSDHIRDSIEHVDEYMGIDLRIASIRVLPCLTALAHKD